MLTCDNILRSNVASCQHETQMEQQRDRYHHGDLRRALLDAALQIATESRATEAVTLREAARRAGVSHNAPYRHFEDKGEMLAVLAEEGFIELARTLNTARAGVLDAEERFVRTGVAYLRFADSHPGHLTVMFGPEIAKSRTARLQRLANDTFQVLKALAKDAGVADEVQARRLGTVVWSLLHGLCVLSRQKQVPASVGATPDELAELGLRQLFRSFRLRAQQRS